MRFLFLVFITFLVVGCSSSSNHNRVPSSLSMENGEFYVKPGPTNKIYIKLSGYESMSTCNTPFVGSVYGVAETAHTPSQYICTMDAPSSYCGQVPGRHFISSYSLKPMFQQTTIGCPDNMPTRKVQISTGWIELAVTPHEGLLIKAPDFKKIDISSRKESFMKRMTPLKLKEPINISEPPIMEL